MNITILGTGMVGRAFAQRLACLGHHVAMGTRDIQQTLARSEPDPKGTPPFAQWQQANPSIRLVPFEDVGNHAELLINATAGACSLEALEAVGASSLAGKVLVELAVPLDYSRGWPPRLSYANDDSLGERIQRAFPATRVVKTLNTMAMNVMVNPGLIPGKHNVFLAGEDGPAKERVKSLLGELGWPMAAMVDLGGIQAARACEMYVPLLFEISTALGTYDFNIAIAKREK